MNQKARTGKSSPDSKPSQPAKPTKPDDSADNARDEELDRELEDSFPASDPPSSTQDPQ